MIGTATSALYLSQLVLNPRSRQVLSEMAYPYEMHRTLMRAFPSESDGGPGRVLFRLEPSRHSGSPAVLVQSEKEPDWAFLERLQDYLWKDGEGPIVSFKDIMPVYQDLHDGQILRFRLRANPTRRIGKRDDPMKGKRVELVREDEQIEWLIRKGTDEEKRAPGGFEVLMKEVQNMRSEIRKVPRMSVCTEGKQNCRKKDAAGRHTTTHLSVLFDGLLRVADKESFLETLICGIGPGKAFGFGLLSVAPCRAPAATDAK